jgi:two-component system osmolarity sensor histidine kinase EnvZ
MQERIRRFVAQRTEMLAGISHDLRTPLTRMRLGLAMLPHAPEAEADVAAITQDVEEMERMVAAYLAFARGEGGEQPRQADLTEIVRDVAQKARRDGAEVAVEAPAALMLPLRPDALRRCLANLLDNARKHARRIAVGVAEVPRDVPAQASASGWAQVTVDDDGPGIPAAQREEAFRPFATLSAGGTGLGLAIARDIARAHGGDIVLEDSPLGGLRARVRLPV